MREKVLIIKHGALGDWILATGAFRLIRQHHPQAKLILLTASPYVSLSKQSAWFDEVWVDNRQGIINTLKTIYKLRRAHFDYVYDMQRSQRTHLYYQFIKHPKLHWSGNIPGAAGFFRDDLERHIVERMALQLQSCQINSFPTPDISWLKADISQFKPSKAYVLIMAGCAKHRPKKRWTASGYSELIEWLYQKNVQTLLVGTDADREIIDSILSNVKEAKPINLMNKTSFAQLAELSRHALLSLGSDTGSMHIAAAANCPSLTLFCLTESNPKYNRAWGEKAKTLEIDSLQTLSAAAVIQAVTAIISD